MTISVKTNPQETYILGPDKYVCLSTLEELSVFLEDPNLEELDYILRHDMLSEDTIEEIKDFESQHPAHFYFKKIYIFWLSVGRCPPQDFLNKFYFKKNLNFF